MHEVRAHPYGVLPLGNLLSESRSHHINKRRKALGSLCHLSDALITRILEALISSSTPRDAAIFLSNFSAVSSYALAFAADDDLWRRLTFHTFSISQIASAPFVQSWRRTFLTLATGVQSNVQPNSLITENRVYSDILFHKWRCLTTAILPDWLKYANIPRISYNSVTVQQFRNTFELPNLPVVITDCVTKWDAFKTWSKTSLAQRYGDTDFHAGGFNFPLNQYLEYCRAIENFDDQPLYIFDSEFASKAPTMADSYKVPSYFDEDLFKVLGSERPDYRWLIIGPARSGSSFHKDPNSTSAWNAVIEGRKKWVMFPPDVKPPGVFPSADEGDVTAPVSISEWFLNYYDRDVLKSLGGRECVVEAGEMIFVPMGWWHCVLNLETSIAITQSYVGSCNIPSVLRWIQSKPKQVSGCRSSEQAAYLVERFAPLIWEKHPELRSLLENPRDFSKPDSVRKDSHKSSKRKRSLWDTLTTPVDEGVSVLDLLNKSSRSV